MNGWDIDVTGKPYQVDWTDNGDDTFDPPVVVPVKNRYNLVEFMDAITDDEYDAIRSVMTVKQVARFWDKTKIRGYIDFNEPDPVTFMTYLVAQTTWTGPRASEVIG